MFITADQLIVHAIGDYFLQSDWMAQQKTKSNIPAISHAICYSLPFLIFKPSIWAFVFILVTHFLIDRFRLARYICWIKNFIAPKWIATGRHEIYHQEGGGDVREIFVRNKSWFECKITGYSEDRPLWLSVWLLIITDNTMHIVCNAIALKWL